MTNYFINTFDPVLLHVGPFAIRWYGVMYIAGFAIALWLLLRRFRAGLLALPNERAVHDMLFYGFLGVLIGGRLGHCLFYHPLEYLRRPWEILMVWEGGMSSHGGFAGVMIALALFARVVHVPFLHLLDNSVLATTPGLFLGRIGNFINGEMCGTPTSLPWAVIFPAVDMQPRHPVQIYQALTEGALLFAILLVVGRKRRADGLLSGLFGVGYAIVRIATEHFRALTTELAGPRWSGLTQGQFLSIFAGLIGVALLLRAMLAARKHA